MSHSQFRRIKTYTETCMDESLRQAYDYWQDQPGSIRRCQGRNPVHQLSIEEISIMVNYPTLTCLTARFRYRMLDESYRTHLAGRNCSNPNFVTIRHNCMTATFAKATILPLRIPITPSVQIQVPTWLRRKYFRQLRYPAFSPGGLAGPTAMRAADDRTHHTKHKPIDQRPIHPTHQGSNSSNASRNIANFWMYVLRFHMGNSINLDLANFRSLRLRTL